MATGRFTWADYLVFVLCLLISAGISIYHGIQGRKESSTSQYLMGGRDMAVLPVAASFVVSMVSAVFVLGVPAETYSFGIYHLLWLSGMLLAVVVACFFYLPVYHSLQLTSVFEYLGRRFNNTVRAICSAMAMVKMLLYSSVVVYAPSIAISQATGLPYWGCILLATAMCTFYTTLGGFKTVIWTDTVQCFIILTGLIATLVKGTLDVGGLGKMLNVSSEGERTHIANITPDFTRRMDAWTWLFGTFPFMLGSYGTSQLSVQRFCSIRSMNKARLAVLCTIPTYTILLLLGVGSGLLAFAYYNGCDPLLSGKIKTRDQILPILVMDVFRDTPGMPGLFMSGILGAALSTLSSVQHSFAVVILEDVIKPVKLMYTSRQFTESEATLVSKVTVVVVGVIIACLSLVAANSGKMVLHLAHAAISLGVAPAVGVFTLGLFVPLVNSKGAITGLFCGIFVLGWATIGALSVPKILQPVLPASTDFCPQEYLGNTSLAHNVTDQITENASSLQSSVTGGLMTFYRISSKYYTLLGSLPVIIVGIIVSLLTGGWQERKRVDDNVLFSCRRYGALCWNNRIATEQSQNDKQTRERCHMGLDSLPQRDQLLDDKNDII